MSLHYLRTSNLLGQLIEIVTLPFPFLPTPNFFLPLNVDMLISSSTVTLHLWLMSNDECFGDFLPWANWWSLLGLCSTLKKTKHHLYSLMFVISWWRETGLNIQPRSVFHSHFISSGIFILYFNGQKVANTVSYAHLMSFMTTYN